MDQYIRRENIALYKKCLSETSDITVRKVLFRLLAEEQAKDDSPGFLCTPGCLENEFQPPR